MHVLISGAGIAGPTLAWHLSKAGIQSTVLEKASSHLAQGQNIDISGSAVVIAKKMGILEEIRRFNTKEQGSRFIGADGKPFARMPINEGSTASPTSEYEILRGDLAAILYNATKDDPLVTYHFGTIVQKVISNNDEVVKVELSNGEVQQYDLLVAADGQWSKLRKQCFPDNYLTVVDKGMYSAWWTIPRTDADDDWWDIYIGSRSRTLSLRPDPHGTIRALASIMPRSEDQAKAWQAVSRSESKAQRELLRHEFSDIGWEGKRMLDGMDHATDFYFQAVQQIKLSNWSVGRVVCLGDAAYAPTPLTGMGTSLAINGAYTLAGELSKVHEGQSILAALDSYEQMYRPFVEKSQSIPSFVPGIAHPQTATKRWLIQSLIWIVAIVIAQVAKISLLSRFVQKPTAEDFPLPKYAAFEKGDKKV